jgi:outer membrane receptor for ferrienterochelin and colicin
MTVLTPFHRVERLSATAAWCRCLATAGALALGAFSAGAQDDSAGRQQLRSLMALDLAELGRLQVFSASRELTSIEQSPSVVTLITAEEIRRREYKRLADVFERIPGFYNSRDAAQSLIAARGFAQNPNNNFLLLVDGHSINTVADEGIGNTHLMPQLHQVKRIEILRGPGSTLWGGDAANGIINIITFEGRDLATTGQPFAEVVIDREFSRPQSMVSFLGGMKLGDSGDVMLSVNYSKSDADFLTAYSIGGTGQRTELFQYKYNAWRPSHEVQLKARWGDFRLNARTARQPGYYRITVPRRDDDIRDFDFDFVEFGVASELAPTWSVDASAYYNRSEVRLRTYRPDGSLLTGATNPYSETGLTAVLTHRVAGSYRLKLGTQVARRNFGGQLVYRNGGEHFESLIGIEQAQGVFAEGEYSALEDWVFTLGARWQRNDFRQPGSDMLYRAAAIWQPAQHWSFKYLFNSGDVRPALARTRGSWANPLIIANPDYTKGPVAEVGPDKAQLAFSHDLQAMYAAGATRATLTLFRQDTKQYVVRANPFSVGTQTSGGIPIWRREINAGELRAYGLEFEAEHRASDAWLVYGNYSMALNRARETVLATGGSTPLNLITNTSYFAPDRRVTAVPKRLWNVGADWSPLEGHVLNLHYRGWSDMWGKTLTGSGIPTPFKHYGTEHIVDLAYSWRNVIRLAVDVQLYVKNVFDNQAGTPQAPRSGEIPGLGREIGVALTIRPASEPGR